MIALSSVLVTGGAGFIGSHVSRALLARGVRVTVLDNLSMGRRESVPDGARLVVGDVRDRAAVSEALHGADAVVHLGKHGTPKGDRLTCGPPHRGSRIRYTPGAPARRSAQ